MKNIKYQDIQCIVRYLYCFRDYLKMEKYVKKTRAEQIRKSNKRKFLRKYANTSRNFIRNGNIRDKMGNACCMIMKKYTFFGYRVRVFLFNITHSLLFFNNPIMSPCKISYFPYIVIVTRMRIQK